MVDSNRPGATVEGVVEEQRRRYFIGVILISVLLLFAWRGKMARVVSIFGALPTDCSLVC